jgi:hypothetical protein
MPASTIWGNPARPRTLASGLLVTFPAGAAAAFLLSASRPRPAFTFAAAGEGVGFLTGSGLLSSLGSGLLASLGSGLLASLGSGLLASLGSGLLASLAAAFATEGAEPANHRCKQAELVYWWLGGVPCHGNDGVHD